MSTTKSSQSENVNPRVELSYAGDCPNVEATRKALHQSLVTPGLPGQWKEYWHDDPA